MHPLACLGQSKGNSCHCPSMSWPCSFFSGCCQPVCVPSQASPQPTSVAIMPDAVVYVPGTICLFLVR